MIEWAYSKRIRTACAHTVVGNPSFTLPDEQTRRNGEALLSLLRRPQLLLYYYYYYYVLRILLKMMTMLSYVTGLLQRSIYFRMLTSREE